MKIATLFLLFCLPVISLISAETADEVMESMSAGVELFQLGVDSKRCTDKYTITEYPQEFQNAFYVTKFRGNDSTGSYSFTLKKNAVIYVCVMDRGTPVIPSHWKETGEKIKWVNESNNLNYTDSIYRFEQEAGQVDIPAHGQNGVPHLCIIVTLKQELAWTETMVEDVWNEILQYTFTDSDREVWVEDQFEIMDRALEQAYVYVEGGEADEVNARLVIGDVQYMCQHIRAEIVALDEQAAWPASTHLSIMDFGAVGDGQHDDGPALRAGIEALRDRRNATLFLLAGRYRIAEAIEFTNNPYSGIPAEESVSGKYENFIQKTRAHLPLNGLVGVTIEGETGTELIFGNPSENGMYLYNCKDVAVKNISIDYDPIPYWQGIIRNIVINPPLPGLGTVAKIDVEYDQSGFPAPWDDMFSSCAHPRARVNSEELCSDVQYPFYSLVAPGGHSFSSIEPLGDGFFRGYISGKEQWDVWKLTVGMRIVFFARMDAEHAARMRSSQRCVFDNITIYSSPSMAFHLGDSASCIVRNCTVKAKPNTLRMYSTSADTMFFPGSTYGHLVKNCTFMNNGDDFFNVHAKARPAYEVDGNKVIMPMAFMTPRVGDRLGVILTSQKHSEIFDVAKIEQVRIVKVEGQGINNLDFYEIILDKEFPELMTLQQPSAEGISDCFVIIETLSHGYVFEGNILTNGCSRMLIGGRHGIIKNNAITHGISILRFLVLGTQHLDNNTWGGEYTTPYNVSINNNTFLCRTSRTSFCLESRVYGSVSESMDIRNVLITGNSFIRNQGSSVPFFYLSNVEDLTISDNQFENQGIPCPDIFHYESGVRIISTNNAINGEPIQ